MTRPNERGVEDARSQLPALLDEAEKGRSTVITRRGRPVAALVPIAKAGRAVGQKSIAGLEGSGRGLWGRDSRKILRRLRDEWNR